MRVTLASDFILVLKHFVENLGRSCLTGQSCPRDAAVEGADGSLEEGRCVLGFQDHPVSVCRVLMIVCVAELITVYVMPYALDAHALLARPAAGFAAALKTVRLNKNKIERVGADERVPEGRSRCACGLAGRHPFPAFREHLWGCAFFSLVQGLLGSLTLNRMSAIPIILEE